MVPMTVLNTRQDKKSMSDTGKIYIYIYIYIPYE